jgi:hypothetical protein
VDRDQSFRVIDIEEDSMVADAPPPRGWLCYKAFQVTTEMDRPASPAGPA